MNTAQKLAFIQRVTGLTQTKLALRFGVSFVTLNSWRLGKSTPRPKKQELIDLMFLELTGQKVIPKEQLDAKKELLRNKSTKHHRIITEILDHPDIRDAFLLKLTYNSNRIEGSTLTEPDTAAILFDNVSLPHKSLTEQLEAKNHQTALNYLFEAVSQKTPFDEALLLRLHGILMNGIRADAGRYRDHAVRILGVNLPVANPMAISRLMPPVLEIVRCQSTDPIAQVAAVHSRFERIHPFSDGNGRVGRMIASFMLLSLNMAPAVIRQEDKQIYYSSLYKAQTTSDQSLLEDFFCDAVLSGFSILERNDADPII